MLNGRVVLDFLSEQNLADISAAIGRARKRPVPWDVLRELIPDNQGPLMRLEDRKGKEGTIEHVRRQRELVCLPGNCIMYLSFEEQPAGTLLHISMSVNGLVPPPEIIGHVADACGLSPATSEVWLEEFLDDDQRTCVAINIVGVVP